MSFPLANTAECLKTLVKILHGQDTALIPTFFFGLLVLLSSPERHPCHKHAGKTEPRNLGLALKGPCFLHRRRCGNTTPWSRGDITAHWKESLPVFCPSDGKTRISSSHPEFIKSTTISVDGVEESTLFPILPVGKRFYSMRLLFGIDKRVYLSRTVTTIKATRTSSSGRPVRPCSVTSFDKSAMLTSGNHLHIDSFSGLVIIGDVGSPRRLVIDFPTHL